MYYPLDDRCQTVTEFSKKRISGQYLNPIFKVLIHSQKHRTITGSDSKKKASASK